MGVVKVSALALALWLGGCSGPTAEPPPPPPPPPAKTVFDPMTQSLERARGVQQTVDQQADATRRDIDAAERGNAP